MIRLTCVDRFELLRRMTTDSSTEDLIKEAARKIFHEKGYEATKTRDIAEASGINLALLNYYFRSKKKLFDQIMMESLQTFLGVIFRILSDPDTSVRAKIQAFVNQYIDMLSVNPNLPIFILSEIRNDPKGLVNRMGIKKKLGHTIFIQQFFAEVEAGSIQVKGNPLHILVNLASMIVFPFMTAPLAKEIAQMNQKEFLALMDERRTLIPMWIDQMLA